MAAQLKQWQQLGNRVWQTEAENGFLKLIIAAPISGVVQNQGQKMAASIKLLLLPAT
jgi:hypothetical protein